VSEFPQLKREKHARSRACSGAARPECLEKAGHRLTPLAFGAAITHWQALRAYAVWLISLSVCFSPLFAASSPVSKEFQVKAVCLWRLAQFVTWPTNSFENSNDPIVIGVLGENPFGDLLEAAVDGETAHGRKLVVKHYRQLEQINTCHVLYINFPDANQVKKVVSALSGKPILTVSDLDQFTMVRFRTEQNKVRLRIHYKAATAAKLVLDSRLLRAAEIIENE
jgi:hypothetical protein